MAFRYVISLTEGETCKAGKMAFRYVISLTEGETWKDGIQICNIPGSRRDMQSWSLTYSRLKEGNFDKTRLSTDENLISTSAVPDRGKQLAS